VRLRLYPRPPAPPLLPARGAGVVGRPAPEGAGPDLALPARRQLPQTPPRGRDPGRGLPRHRGGRRKVLSARAHGALVEVEGLGVLLLGPSGIGKSDGALELVRRGHRLVADDVVLLERDAEGRLFGTAPEIIRHHMELRGIGIVYLPDLFGPEAVRDRAEIGLGCRLAEWRPDLEVERVGLDRPT